MARLLDALKEQGIEITAEIENKLLKEFTEKKELELKDVEVTNLNEQIKQRDADIIELKKTNPEELKAKFADLEKKYTEDTKVLEKTLEETKVDGALKLALAQSGTVDVDVLAGLINREGLKISEGKLSGLTEQLEQLKTNKPFLFPDTQNKENKSGYEYKPDAGKVTENNTGSLGDAIAERLGLQ